MSWSGLPTFIEDRIMPEPNTGCWIWIGSQLPVGYGRLTLNRRDFFAHRISYLCFKGLIPNNLVVDHQCNNKWCVNPDHLEAVTQGENVRRARRLKTTCNNGHPITATNIKLVSGWIKMCSICYYANQKRSIARRKAKREISKKIRRDVLDGILDPYGLAI